MEERFALYYPYIHFRDPRWLKSTLLTFGQVRRMVPTEFVPDDDPLVHELSKHKTAGGMPLIASEHFRDQPTIEAQRRLQRHLEAQPPQVSQFGEGATIRQQRQPFHLVPDKIHQPVLHFLLDQKLAWHSRAWDGATIAMHPCLADALMSVSAIAIAKAKGLSVVTSNARVHKSLSDRDEAAVFDSVSGRSELPGASSVGPEELLHAVLVNTIDLDSLSANDVASLARDANGLRKLRTVIEAEARHIPSDITDPAERATRAKMAATRIEEQWRASKGNALVQSVKAVVDVSTLDLPATINGLIAGTTVATVSLGAGLAVLFVTYAGVRAWHGYREAIDSPYRYLTLAEHKTSISALAVAPSPPPQVRAAF